MGVLLTIILLGLIIFLHELGHFMTAKWFKMPVKEFSLGMGPKLISKKFGETVYSIRVFPLGGFVNISGMEEKEIEKDAIIVETEEEINKILEENDDAIIYTQEEIDEINYDNENGFFTKSPLQRFIVLIAGVAMNFLSAFIVLFFVVTAMTEIAHDIGFLLQLKITWKLFLQIFYETLNGVKLLFTGHVAPKEMTGPVGLPKVVGQIYKSEGISVMKNIFALLSVNIGIMNLLPIPALDGGRILFVIPEFFGIKVNKKVENIIHMCGMILLIILMLFIMFNDIMNYFR